MNDEGRTFELTRSQLDRYNVWATKYLKKIRKQDSISKVTFSFVFTDTGIGTNIMGICNWDHHSIDLTDYENW